MLPEDKRKQLDGIVQQMAANKESDDTIRFVVDDFKKKYTPVAQSVQPQGVPLLTKPNGGFGTALKDVAVGAGKGLLRGAIDTAGLLQKGGQAALAGITSGKSYQDVKQTTGFKPLDSSTPQGMGVQQTLAPKSTGEKIGGYLETAGELATGFAAAKGPQAVTKAKQAYTAGKELKATEKVIESVTPRIKDLGKADLEEALLKGKVEPKTATQPAKYVLSDAEKQVALKNRSLITKDPVETSKNIVGDIAKKDKLVGEFLEKNNGIFNGGELKNHIINSMKDITDISIPPERIEALKNTMADGFINALKKNDMKSLWEARKAFDQSIEKVFSGSPTLQKTIKKQFRNAVQDFIAQKTPEGVYKKSMRDMTELYDLFDVVADKANSEKGRNAVQVWIKNNPTKAKVVGWGLGAVGAQQIYQAAQ